MNQLYILLTAVASIAVALAAIGIFNQTHAQNNETMMTGNMTGGNATMMTPGNDTGMSGNDTVGQISKKGR